jgi:hypothetical protein
MSSRAHSFVSYAAAANDTLPEAARIAAGSCTAVEIACAIGIRCAGAGEIGLDPARIDCHSGVAPASLCGICFAVKGHSVCSAVVTLPRTAMVEWDVALATTCNSPVRIHICLPAALIRDAFRFAGFEDGCL